MTLTNIEKAAKLLMLIRNRKNPDDEKDYLVAIGFNPYTNKADLSDVIDALEIQVYWYPEGTCTANKIYRHSETHSTVFEADEVLDFHPDKFTARAHAVMAVIEQIYDAKFGKDGE